MVLAELIKLKHGLYKSCGINVHHARTMFTPTMFSRGRSLKSTRVRAINNYSQLASQGNSGKFPMDMGIPPL